MPGEEKKQEAQRPVEVLSGAGRSRRGPCLRRTRDLQEPGASSADSRRPPASQRQPPSLRDEEERYVLEKIDVLAHARQIDTKRRKGNCSPSLFSGTEIVELVAELLQQCAVPWSPRPFVLSPDEGHARENVPIWWAGTSLTESGAPPPGQAEHSQDELPETSVPGYGVAEDLHIAASGARLREWTAERQPGRRVRRRFRVAPASPRVMRKCFRSIPPRKSVDLRALRRHASVQSARHRDAAAR